MPRNQGTSRKGKPKKNDRMAGMGRSLQRAQPHKHKSKPSKGGMAMTPGVQSLNIYQEETRASVLEMNDLDDFLMQAEMANREFASEREQLVILDTTTTSATMTLAQNNAKSISWEDQPSKPSFTFQELSVPRRPKWDETTTPAQLDVLEKESFLEWRRAIARREEQVIIDSNAASNPMGVTPFEKNLEIWRQLWRVMERCSCIVQIVDARNPLFYLSKDLKAYATEELGKPMMLCVNKSDYLTSSQRQAWHDYFSHPDHQWDHIFFSAHEEQQILDHQAAELAAAEDAMRNQPAKVVLDDDKEDDDDEDDDENPADHGNNNDHDGDNNNDGTCTATNDEFPDINTKTFDRSNVGVEHPLSREQMLEWLCNYANDRNCNKDLHYNRIPFGMVGFPNVGKSSVINVLMGNSRNSHGVTRVGVAAQPGKTKHFQTLLLPNRDDMMLCDCPGLVFPSFVNNTADLIAAGVFPISQMRDPWPVVNLLCKRIPREILNAQYGIKIPLPTSDAMLEAAAATSHTIEKNGQQYIPPPTAEEFLTTYCHARGMFAASSGVPDYPRAARVVIKDYATGKLLYCHAPPTAVDEKAFHQETMLHSLQKTEKLRSKLVKASDGRPSNNQEVDEDDYSDNDDDDDDDNNSNEDDDSEDYPKDSVEDDDMLLELMGETSLATITPSNAPSSSKPPRKKKWGRKGRKVRNKDPYGCHSTPDDMLVNNGGASMKIPNGVSVKAGKYGRKGYTRPTGFGAAVV